MNAFTGENYIANKTTVVGLGKLSSVGWVGLVADDVAGVNHSELLDITERSLFGVMPEVTEVNYPTDEYIGGLCMRGLGYCIM